MNLEEQYVHRGAKLLDEKLPGWADKINPSMLMMDSPYYCVLGQLYGYYDIGYQSLNLMSFNVRDHHGFTCEIYQEHWITEITKRLSKDSTNAN